VHERESQPRGGDRGGRRGSRIADWELDGRVERPTRIRKSATRDPKAVFTRGKNNKVSSNAGDTGCRKAALIGHQKAYPQKIIGRVVGKPTNRGSVRKRGTSWVRMSRRALSRDIRHPREQLYYHLGKRKVKTHYGRSHSVLGLLLQMLCLGPENPKVKMIQD